MAEVASDASHAKKLLKELQKRVGMSKSEWTDAVDAEKLKLKVQKLEAELQTERDEKELMREEARIQQAELERAVRREAIIPTLEAERAEMVEKLQAVQYSKEIKETSPDTIHSALADMEAKVQAAVANEEAAKATAAQLTQELANEHKLCDQFRVLLTSMKAAFAEERERRLEVEKTAGVVSSKPTPKPKVTSMPPPPDFPASPAAVSHIEGGVGQVQVFQAEIARLQEQLKESNKSVDQRLQQRMKTMHIVSLDEFQDEVATQEKAYSDLLARMEQQKQGHLGELDAVKLELEKQKRRGQELQAENVELEDRIQQIMNLSSLHAKLNAVGSP